MNPIASFFSHAPRGHLFTKSPLTYRAFTSTTSRHLASSSSSSSNLNTTSTPTNSPSNRSASAFNRGPAPPRLPKEDQEIFETLQRQSTGAFSTPRAKPQINQSPHANVTETANAETVIGARVDKIGETPKSVFKEDYKKIIEARGKGEELHPNVRRGAEPEFEGDRNPKTGEVGGPKNEPLRWGGGGEWSYNGRTTDF